MMIFFITLLSSCVNVSFEFLLARNIALLTSQKALWESLSAGFYLLGMGLGTLRTAKYERLANLQLKLGIVVLIALPLLKLFHSVYHIYAHDYVNDLSFIVGLTAQSLTLSLGMLAGTEMQILFRRFGIYVLLFASHAGAACAALLFYFLITLDDIFASLLLASGNLLAFSLWIRILPETFQRTTLVSFFALFAAIFCCGKKAEELYLQNLYYNTISVSRDENGKETTGPLTLHNFLATASHLSQVTSITTPYQLMEIVPEHDKPGFTLYLDRHYQFRSQVEKAYHEFFAHVPLAVFSPLSAQFLVLGGGDGLLLRELLKYKQSFIHLVEIDAHMLQLARHGVLSELNQQSLTSSRVHTQVADALTWLQEGSQLYSGIFLDFPYPYDYEGLRLYSVEFLRRVRRKLTADGFLAMDFPVDFTNPRAQANTVIVSTLKKAGFVFCWAYRFGGEAFILAAPTKADFMAQNSLPEGLTYLKHSFFELYDDHLNLNDLYDDSSINFLLRPQTLGIKDFRF